jgi:hypothetical protein
MNPTLKEKLIEGLQLLVCGVIFAMFLWAAFGGIL